MKIYSNVLTWGQLIDALPADVIASIQVIRRPRVAARGWKVYLEGTGTRHTKKVNSGESGAGYHSAATYDDHGEWMARLFAIDPDARISWWKNRADFDKGTEYRYSDGLWVS